MAWAPPRFRRSAPVWRRIPPGHRSGFDAPREHEALDPVRVVEPVATHPPEAFARLDHRPVPFVDADVRDERSAGVGREEEQVATFQTGAGPTADLRLADGAARKLDAEALMDELHQARAVERIGAFGTPDVRFADHPSGEGDDISRYGCGRRRDGKDEQRHDERARDSWNHGSPGLCRQTERGSRGATGQDQGQRAQCENGCFSTRVTCRSRLSCRARRTSALLVSWRR